MKTTVSEKGQVTIPKALRDKLGLVPGVILQFDAIKGQLVGRKQMAGDPFKKWRGRGKLPKAMTVDMFLRRARDGHGSR
ncbi:MAG: AbrB/MazE/SpoVT family DNA-binding domain-containing protein [Chthoniobacterales bacterium]